MARLGLFLHDNLGDRDVLSGTKSIDLCSGYEGAPLNAKFKVVQAVGPWVGDVLRGTLKSNDQGSMRPLFDDGASRASTATRDYVLKMDQNGDAPSLNIFGGKITTYRVLAENALDQIGKVFGDLPKKWTAGVAFPGGDFLVDRVQILIASLRQGYAFLDDLWATRLVRAYGTEASEVLGQATTKNDLGMDFGYNLIEREAEWLIEKEYVRTAEDIVWRRSKIGLRLTIDQIATLDTRIKNRLQKPFSAVGE